MPESQLSLTYFDYLGETGVYLGYGRGDLGDNTDVTWTSSQEAVVTRLVSAGQRQFYFPPPLEGQGFAHEWTFLKPVGTVTLAEGQTEVNLPDDFGGFDGPATVTTGDSTGYPALTLTGESRVRTRLAESPDTTGPPQMVALNARKGLQPDRSPGQSLSFWPVADADYTIGFRYTLLPEAITGAKPYSYGGMAHVETVLASCLERAEFYKDNARGVCWMNWQDRLSASISIDRRRRPVSLGPNADGSDAEGGMRSNYWTTVTYNGVTP